MYHRTFLVFILLLLSDIIWGQRGFKTEEEKTPLVTGQTYAIIIGISKYKEVPSLQFAHRDAQAFEALLTSPAGGNVPKANIEVFLDEEATRNNVADAISITARKAKLGDRVYFFFAGHGDMEDLTQIENGLLLLHNSPNGNYFGMKDDVLELLDLKRYLSPLAQRGIEMIFIVDACHSGNLKGGIEGMQLTAQSLSNAWGKEYKILSCQPNQLSQEGSQWGNGRGLFALQLEEGIKGLADLNGDGTVSFADELKKQKEQERLTIGSVNMKGSEDRYADSLPEIGKQLYASFRENLKKYQLIWPQDRNAMQDYRSFTNLFPQHPLTTSMRRNLAAALNVGFDSIVNPMLRGETSYSTKDICYYAGMEMDSCISLLGESHYMYRNLRARSLFMKAMGLTWAISEDDYNISMLNNVRRSIGYMEESESLEPNTAYTIGQLGIHYSIIGEYKKANVKFEKYLALRPNDFWAKQSLADIYQNLGLYAKAETLYRDLIRQYPRYSTPYQALSRVLYEQGKKAASREILQPLLTQGIDTMNYFFLMGLWSTNANLTDSAIYWYRKCYAYEPALESTCLNNIGHNLIIRGLYDSAQHLFNRVIEIDSSSPFPYFNLGSIDMLLENYPAAIDYFIRSIELDKTNNTGYLTGLSNYYGKKYKDNNSKAFQQFNSKMRIFKLEYLNYLSILYIYLRVPEMISMEKNIDLIFEQLGRFKQYEATTAYHRACYLSLIGNTEGALKTIEESLKKGFGDSFALRNDLDLVAVQKLPSFGKLMKEYFY